MSCEYSVPYPGTQSALSSDGAFISAVTAGNRLSIRNQNSLEVSNIFQCVDKIDKIEISPDCCYVLCALYSRNVIQVFSVEDKDWKCRINEGVAGMINAYWTPDSRNVVVESDFGIQVSIWSLTDSNSVIISLPKPPYTMYSKTGAFSDCGRFFALVHRIELQDQIGVYSVASQTSLGMSEISKFRARSNDVASIYWVPGGTHIITLDSPLTYKFCAYTPMGECLATYEAYQNALGVRSIALCRPLPVQLPTTSATLTTTTASASSATSAASGATGECKFIALGSFDGKVRLLSVYSWQVAFALPLLHPRELEAGFNSQNLLLTVEVSVSGATRFGTGSAAEEEDESADPTAALGENGAAVQVKQHQVPPAKQVLRSALYVPSRLHGVLLDRDGQAIQLNVTDMEKTGQRLQHAAASVRALQSMDSYFALRATKTLPRAQAFQLEGKRTNTSTLSSTARRTTSGGAATTYSASTVSTSTSISTSSGSAGYPAVGVSWVGWSSDNQLLAAREESHPRCVWVWRPLQAQLVAVLVLLEPVTCARWRPLPRDSPPNPQNQSQNQKQDQKQPNQDLPVAPHSPSTSVPPVPPPSEPVCTEQAISDPAEETEVLAFCTGTPRVYFWSPLSGVTYSDMSTLTLETSGSHTEEGLTEHASSSAHSQDRGFPVTSLVWSKDGKSLLLRGKEAHCLCRVTLPAAQLRR